MFNCCAMAIESDGLSEALEEFMTRLMKLSEVDGMDALVKLDLSFSQARVLFLLAKTGEPMPIHAIATALRLSDAATGRNVDQLLKLDIVERRESSEDRRVKLVSLTSRGEQLSTNHFEAKRTSIKAFMADLPPEQRDNLHRALTDILAGDLLRQRHDQENYL